MKVVEVTLPCFVEKRPFGEIDRAHLRGACKGAWAGRGGAAKIQVRVAGVGIAELQGIAPWLEKQMDGVNVQAAGGMGASSFFLETRADSGAEWVERPRRGR